MLSERQIPPLAPFVHYDTLDVGGDYLRDSLAACAPDGRWREWWFVSLALRYYLDESESQAENDPAVTVAGYVGKGKEWMRFKNVWNSALDLAPKRVTVFHARDYAKGHSSKWGTYHGWTVAERDKFINRLIHIIRRRYRFFDAGCVIHRSTFNQVAIGGRSNKHGDLFVIAAKVAMVNVATWAKRQGSNHAPSFYVELGAKYVEAMREALKQLQTDSSPEIREFFRLSAIAEVPKSREYPQTQPADFLAYYCSQWASRLTGFDPYKESFDSYGRRKGIEMPDELARLLTPKNGITYHTPASLNLLWTALESGKSLAEIDSILNED